MDVYECKLENAYGAGLTIVAANSKAEAFDVLQFSVQVYFKDYYRISDITKINDVHYDGNVPTVLSSAGYVE